MLEICNCDVARESEECLQTNENIDPNESDYDVKQEEIQWLDRIGNNKMEHLIKMQDKKQFLQQYHSSVVLIEQSKNEMANKWENRSKEILSRYKRCIYLCRM